MASGSRTSHSLCEGRKAALGYGSATGVGSISDIRFDASAINNFNSYYGQVHPFNAFYIEALLAGNLPRVWTSEYLARPVNILRHSEFHADWLRPNRLFHC